MIIEDIMKKNIVKTTEDTSIAEAIQLLKKHHIRHLLVSNEDNELVGIVSDRDLKAAMPSVFIKNATKEDMNQPISKIMTTVCITAHPLDFVEDVASLFYQFEIGCLPILEQNKIVGIVTETDLLHTLVELTGAHQPSSQIEIEVEDITGKLAEVASFFKEHHIQIISVLVYPSKKENYRVLVFRIQTIDPVFIVTELKKRNYNVIWPQIPGVDL